MKNQKGVSLITLIITIIVVIILAVIVLRSGASDAPDQAAFSGFTQEMGELQDNMKTAMLTAKGDEALKGNQRSEAQLYNFVARGGYDVVSGDNMWLTQADADRIPCTLINRDEAEDTLGAALPTRKVETAKGTNQLVSYFVTPEGNVFCWPPYVYDEKSYVAADVTLSGDYSDVKATSAEKVTIEFENGETVVVANSAADATQSFERKDGEAEGIKAAPSVWYGSDKRDGEVSVGYTFDSYLNDTTTPAPTPDPDPDPEG